MGLFYNIIGLLSHVVDKALIWWAINWPIGLMVAALVLLLGVLLAIKIR